MSLLASDQKQLIFDYYFGLTTEKQSAKAKTLVDSSQQAADLLRGLQAVVSRLDTYQVESCPDQLVEKTVARLNNYARSSQLHLQQLLATEQAHGDATRWHFWRNFGEMLAAAAVILFFSGVLVTSLNFARHKSWRQQCQMQLARIFQGINNYSSDHDGQLPSVATTADAPWWKVGYQGRENHSNTRHIWLLVKGRYIDPTDFVCPARRHGRAIRFDPSEAIRYNDFPDRRCITYSFRICGRKAGLRGQIGRKLLMADLNPLFENLPGDYAGQFRLRLSRELRQINSSNHNHHGQNVLFGDGAVQFEKTRRLGAGADDIFTLQNTPVYSGCEVPSCESDVFLAP